MMVYWIEYKPGTQEPGFEPLLSRGNSQGGMELAKALNVLKAILGSLSVHSDLTPHTLRKGEVLIFIVFPFLYIMKFVIVRFRIG